MCVERTYKQQQVVTISGAKQVNAGSRDGSRNLELSTRYFIPISVDSYSSSPDSLFSPNFTV